MRFRCDRRPINIINLIIEEALKTEDLRLSLEAEAVAARYDAEAAEALVTREDTAAREEEAASDDCPICMQPLQEVDTRVFACGHRFCTACAEQVWRLPFERKTCPKCRMQITRYPETLESARHWGHPVFAQMPKLCVFK